VVAVGGGVQGGLWTQVVSDVTQRPQELRTVSLGASYGGALLAAQLVSDADIERWNPVREVVTPRPETAERYDRHHALYLELYRATADVVHQLAALQHR
jgi:xylulokinase